MDLEKLEALRAMPEVDFSQVGRPILDDTRGEQIEVNMDEQPEIVHAALAALQNMNIPNSSIAVYEHEGTIRLSNETSTFIESGNSKIYLEDQGVTLDNAGSHIVGASIDITPQEGGGYQVSLRTDHFGTYDDSKVDASTTMINYEIAADGSVTSRVGNAHTQEFGANITEQEHGKWTIEAAQTLEGRFSRIMGGQTEIDINAARPDSAATQVGEPPMNDNSVALSTLNLQNMLGNQSVQQAPAVSAPGNAL